MLWAVPALDSYQHYGIGQCAQSMFDISGQVEVVVYLHGLPGVMCLNFDAALHAEQGDGPCDRVGWNLPACLQAGTGA